jgi:hypothetical protein
MGETNASGTKLSSALDRRVFLRGGAALVGAGVAAGIGTRGARAAVPQVKLGPEPKHLPARQHAWADYLHKDKYGNPIAPMYDRLIFFDVRGKPTAAHVRLLEANLRALERRFKWGPDGLLFTVSWGYAYFKKVLRQKSSPVPRGGALSTFEKPRIDTYDMCIHVACDDQKRLAEITRGLLYGAHVDGIDGSLSLRPAFVWRDTRTGFTGVGIPAANQNVHGIPAGDPVPKSSPLFMGFKSGLKKNQASEDRVTIKSGSFKNGTTMQVSYMRQTLDSWYSDLTQEERIARMYSPQTTAADVAKLTTDAPANHSPAGVLNAIKKYGVIGHSQAAATARKNNEPLIIRRDFDTVDGGYAGLHFVSVQASIQDFVVTRNAMNANSAHDLNKKITATKNNGINAFIEVRRRANYMMPSRADRSFPLWAGREQALK